MFFLFPNFFFQVGFCFKAGNRSQIQNDKHEKKKKTPLPKTIETTKYYK